MQKDNGLLFSVVFAAFFLTGAAGLIYQVVWTRMLHLVFGVTLYAAASVVVAFMAGLGAGSWFSASIVRKAASAARTYAIFELGIGVFGFLSPAILAALYESAPSFYSAFVFGGENGPAWLFARFAACLLVLFIPTFLMGATLPLLLKYLVERDMGEGEGLGALYGANTLGACAGALASGFFLIPSAGLAASAKIAAALNLIAAGAVYWADRAAGKSGTATDGTELPTEGEIPGAEGGSTTGGSEKNGDPKFRGSVLLFIFVSGFVALGYEMVWTRIFTMFLKNAPYAFSVMLAVYLAGTGAGAAAYSKFSAAAGEASKRAALVALNFFSPIAAYIGYSLLIEVYRKFDAAAGYADMFSGYLWSAAAAGAAAVLPVSLLMGATLPAAIETLVIAAGKTPPQETAGTAGRLYALNTLGAIAGTVAAGFAMIPGLGLNVTMTALLLAGFAAALALCAFVPLKNPMARPLFLWAGVFVAYLLFNTPDVPRFIATDRMERVFPGGRFVYYNDDEVATVGVENGGMLFVDARPMTIRVTVLKMMAHLPLALADDPRKMLVLCLGEGGTFGSAQVNPDLKIDALELSPSVVEAYSKIYSNGKPVSPNARIITGDGRNYVHLTGERYDVITIDPPPPLYGTGAVHFHTVEFYRGCRAILNEGGVICQWFPYQSDKRTYLAALKSFAEVFPECAVWSVPEDVGLLMTGTVRKKFEINAGKFAKYFSRPAVAANMAEFTKGPARNYVSNPYYLLSLAVNDGEGIARLAAGIPPVTDDSPSLEFSYAAYCSELEAAYSKDGSKYPRFTRDLSDKKRKIFRLCPDLSQSLADCQDPVSHYFAALLYASAGMKPDALLEAEMARSLKLPENYDMRAIEEAISAMDSAENSATK